MKNNKTDLRPISEFNEREGRILLRGPYYDGVQEIDARYVKFAHTATLWAKKGDRE
jgi:hypothetical protein